MLRHRRCLAPSKIISTGEDRRRTSFLARPMRSLHVTPPVHVTSAYREFPLHQRLALRSYEDVQHGAGDFGHQS